MSRDVYGRIVEESTRRLDAPPVDCCDRAAARERRRLRAAVRQVRNGPRYRDAAWSWALLDDVLAAMKAPRRKS